MNSVVALVGFMAAGKTTIAQRLAPVLKRPFVDLDATIESTAGRTIFEIFSEEGEESFRRREREALEQVLATRPCVLAAGGGTVVDPENRRRLKSRATVIWLDPEFSLVRARIGPQDGQPRPLVQSLGLEGLQRLYTERRLAYAAAAHVRVSVGQKSPLTLARGLGALLEQIHVPELLRCR